MLYQPAIDTKAMTPITSKIGLKRPSNAAAILITPAGCSVYEMHPSAGRAGDWLIGADTSSANMPSRSCPLRGIEISRSPEGTLARSTAGLLIDLKTGRAGFPIVDHALSGNGRNPGRIWGIWQFWLQL